MRAKIPYHRQTRADSCGVATAKVVAGYYGIRVSDQELIKMLKIDEIRYTTKGNLRALMNQWNLAHQEFAKEVTYQDREGLIASGQLIIVPEDNLEQMLDQIKPGKIVIVNYAPRKWWGHYAIACGYDRYDLIIHDPERGPYRHISYDRFLKKWRSGDRDWKNWSMVVGRK